MYMYVFSRLLKTRSMSSSDNSVSAVDCRMNALKLRPTAVGKNITYILLFVVVMMMMMMIIIIIIIIIICETPLSAQQPSDNR